MALLEVIKYEGDNDTLVWKHPEEDFSTGSTLIVHESQEAVFFKNGVALDTFGAGRYKLSTQNIPLLSKLINLPTGGVSPFHCEVYYINKANIMEVHWGTPNPVVVMDPVYTIQVPMSAYGEMSLRITDSNKVLLKLVGTTSSLSKADAIKKLRSYINQNASQMVSELMSSGDMNIFNYRNRTSEVQERMMEKASQILAKYGISVDDLSVEISFDENSESYRSFTKSLNATRDMKMRGYDYNTMRTFDTLQTAAANEGSGVMNAGIGLGMGVNLGSIFGGTMAGFQNSNPMNTGNTAASAGNSQYQAANNNQYQAANTTQSQAANNAFIFCPECGNKLPKGAKFCMQCGTKIQEAEPVCPGCGKPLPAGAKFCMECGTRIQ